MIGERRYLWEKSDICPKPGEERNGRLPDLHLQSRVNLR